MFWRTWNTAAETDIGQCIYGKPFPIENTVRALLKISASVGEEVCGERNRANRYVRNPFCLNLGSGGGGHYGKITVW